MLRQRKLNKPDVHRPWTILLTEGSCSVITFSLSVFKPKGIKDQFPGVKDRYDNI